MYDKVREDKLKVHKWLGDRGNYKSIEPTRTQRKNDMILAVTLDGYLLIQLDLPTGSLGRPNDGVVRVAPFSITDKLVRRLGCLLVMRKSHAHQPYLSVGQQHALRVFMIPTGWRAGGSMFSPASVPSYQRTPSLSTCLDQ